MRKTKNLAVALLGLLSIFAGLYLIRTIDEPQHIMRTLPYLCIGIGIGLFGNGIAAFVNKKALEKDPLLANQEKINSKDERNMMIENMAKAKSFDLMIYIYSALLLTFALMGVSFNVIIPLVIAYLFVVGYFVYHRLKIEKIL